MKREPSDAPRPDGETEDWDALYQELHRVARHAMAAQRPDHTLSPTALVHEAFLKVHGSSMEDASDRSHVLRRAGRAMRHILVDHARRRAAERHGGDLRKVTLDTSVPETNVRLLAVLELEDALDRLAATDGRLVDVLELRIYAGLTAKEAAEVMGVSKRTADTAYRKACDWLRENLGT